MSIKLGEQEPTPEKIDSTTPKAQAGHPSIEKSRLAWWQLACKRLIDILVSIVGATLFVPLWLVAGTAIKLNSKGSVLYRQIRIGKNGRPFTLYKFRSMYENADEMLGSLDELNEAEGPVFKIRNDPRVTKVGAILRRTSLDEFPQIINVLKGNMSLVGPRPPLPQEVEKYGAYERGRLVVKPGLTCLWQIQGRSNVSFEKWVALDLEYIRRQSLWLDFKILLKTMPAVIKGTGAW